MNDTFHNVLQQQMNDTFHNVLQQQNNTLDSVFRLENNDEEFHCLSFIY